MRDVKWQPTATLTVLQKRVEIIDRIRQFFKERDVLEVETPLLARSTVTDPYISSIPAIFQQNNLVREKVFLQTSPEYAMKRLLAAGSGSIFQICKAFRQGDLGRMHNPEFTMLEWYRIGFDHHALMKEMDELLQCVLQTPAAEYLTYANAFEKYVRINPHRASLDELQQCVKQHDIDFVNSSHEKIERNFYLNLLLTHCVEPKLSHERPTFIYDFPASQAALAKIRIENGAQVASRFEVYFKNIELANGFHELQDAKEQRARFENDLRERKESVPIDEEFLAALEAGLPDCAGVALGVDRLIMVALGLNALSEVLTFPFAQ